MSFFAVYLPLYSLPQGKARNTILSFILTNNGVKIKESPKGLGIVLEVILIRFYIGYLQISIKLDCNNFGLLILLQLLTGGL